MYRICASLTHNIIYILYIVYKVRLAPASEGAVTIYYIQFSRIYLR